MSVEVRPAGVKCNIACQYCYQNVLRDSEWGDGGKTDLEAIKRVLLERNEGFHLFGGEPLLMNIDELEELFHWGLEQFGENGIQTNGALVTDYHIEIFKKYKVEVGVSIDGPESLNDARWAGSLKRTREATNASVDAINRLCLNYKPPSLMIQLTRCNAIGSKLEKLCEWLETMHGLGVVSARIHILEIDNAEVRNKYGLTVDENIAAFKRMVALQEKIPGLDLDCNNDKKELLLMEDDDVACIWRACDPLYTEAVKGIGSQGEAHKCGLTDKEGVNFQRTEQQNFIRYVALAATPQQYGGCQGCRFFSACKGQCPGTGINGDWRNRSETCEVFKGLFEQAESILLAEGRLPLSLHSAREQVEHELDKAWRLGENPTLAQIKQNLKLTL